VRDRPRARPIQLIVAALPLAAFPKCYLDDLVIRKTLGVHGWIERASRALPVDGLEFYWAFVPHDDAAALRDIRTQLEAHNLAMPMMCYSSDFTKPAESDREIEIAKQKRAIEVTEFLGGKFCGVLSGQRRPGLSRARGLQIVAECIMALLPFAECRGIALVLENHYKDGYWDYPE